MSRAFFFLPLLFLLACGSEETTITLQTNDGEGVEGFAPEDQEFHVLINVGSNASDPNVRMELTAVETEAGSNQSVLTEDLDLGGLNNQADFTVTLPRPWPVGSYRVDAFIDDSLAASKTFRIE